MTGAEIAETFASWLNAGRTGVIEWRDDRRRRLFYFEHGEVVLVQSNLRSESPQRIAELHPDADEQELRELLAGQRLRGALTEANGAVTMHVGVIAPERQPVDIVRMLCTCADVLPRPAYQGYPRVRAQGMHWLERLRVAPPLRITLAELDGTRPVEEVVEFAGIEPDVVQNALALAVLLGAVDVSPHESETAQVLSSRPAYRPPQVPAPERPFGGAPAAASAPAAPAAAAPAAPTPAAAAPAAPTPAAAPSRGARLLHGLFDDTPLAPPLAAAASAVTGPTVTPSAVTAPVLPAPPGAPPAAAPPPLEGASHEVVLPPRRPNLQSTLGAAADRILAAKDHFTVLGAAWMDPPDTLRKQYFQLARELHPDRWSTAAKEDRDAAELLFERVRAAWEVLGSEESRLKYISRVVRGEKTDEEKAQERLRQIIDAENDYRRGLTEYGAGRMLPANELFLRASAMVPEDQEMRAYAGYTTFRVHAGRNDAKAEEGIQEIQAAIRANDRLDQGYVLLGLVQWARGDETAARAAFIKALRIRPANPDAVRELKRLTRVMDPDDAGRSDNKRADGSKAPEAAGLFSRLFGKKK